MMLSSTTVPPYSLWVEGDNVRASYDSNDHGPISKKLLVGVAEYIVWPPSRIGKIHNHVSETNNSTTTTTVTTSTNDSKGWQPTQSPRAYWP